MGFPGGTLWTSMPSSKSGSTSDSPTKETDLPWIRVNPCVPGATKTVPPGGAASTASCTVAYIHGFPRIFACASAAFGEKRLTPASEIQAVILSMAYLGRRRADLPHPIDPLRSAPSTPGLSHPRAPGDASEAVPGTQGLPHMEIGVSHPPVKSGRSGTTPYHGQDLLGE